MDNGTKWRETALGNYGMKHIYQVVMVYVGITIVLYTIHPLAVVLVVGWIFVNYRWALQMQDYRDRVYQAYAEELQRKAAALRGDRPTINHVD